jgi:hypothetical protein
MIAMLFGLCLCGGPPKFEGQQIGTDVGKVVYAVTTADVNADSRPDVVAATEDAVLWYENPKWAQHEVIRGRTERDNVCIQAEDIDRDGQVDFALGAAWRPTDTQGGGTLQWLGRDREGRWDVHPLTSEPTVHRIRFGDVLGTGRPQLVVAPLQGRGTKPPRWDQGSGVRILVLSVPDDPVGSPWSVEVANDQLHTVHNLQVVDFDRDGRMEILLCAWEGVFVLKRDSAGKWSTRKIGEGNQAEAPPAKGASEVKLGRFGDGSPYVATIEPWHGFQVVVYTPSQGEGTWTRSVIDEPITGGHAVWVANLDDDPDEEIVIGHRERSNDPNRAVRGPAVLVYDAKSSNPPRFERLVVDDGGVAVEDLLAADLDGDGRPEIIAGGRATRNVKIYWNR